MRVMRNICCALSAALWLAGSSFGASAPQGEVTVNAQIQTGLVKLGSQAVAQVTVEGTTQARILAVEDVEGLEYVGSSGAKRSVFEQITRGRRVRSESLTWSLVWRPERVGTFEIPPIRMEIDGREVLTQAMSVRVIEDFEGQNLGYLEWIDAPTEVYEGQPFDVVLRFGWDSGMTSFNHANLILPWWGQLPGTLELAESSKVSPGRLDVSLNDNGVVRVQELGRKDVGGRDLRVFELRRSFVSTRTGKLSFPASHFEFGRVDRGFFERRRDIYYVAWPGFEVDVRSLPEEGRPFEFSGGVGRFKARASLDRRGLDLGESLKLSVEWTGAGNLEFFEAPDLGREDAFSGFRSYGATDRFFGNRRVVIYDLAPKDASINEVPAVSLSVFDPESESYETVLTSPIPIRIRVPEGFEGLSLEGAGEIIGFDLHDISTTPRQQSEGPASGLLLGLPLMSILGWIALRREVRLRGDPGSMSARRRRRSRRKLRRGLKGAVNAREQAHALRLFLADRTAMEATAWEGQDVASYAGSVEGVDSSAVVALAEVMSELEASIWSGDGAVLERHGIQSAADEAMGGGL
jgi:hypothetical protein